MSAKSTTRSPKKVNIALWVAQGLLAALFLFAGTSKLLMPVAELARLSAPLSGGFMQFIGVCETLGAIGLILPALTRIRPALTALAASGLVIIMIGAVVMTLITPKPALAVVPFTVGLLCGFIAYGRAKIVPISGTTRRWVLHPAG